MFSAWNSTSRRNTGVRLTWQFSPLEVQSQPEQRFLEDNKHFILLANVIHQHDFGSTGNLQELKDSFREMKMQDRGCKEGEIGQTVQDFLSEKFENISSEPIHNDDITEETLEIAADLYFTVLTCPFQNSKISWILYFYKNLFERQSLETALKTLARILYVMVNENNNKVYQYEEYNIAKALFDKLTSVFNLRNRDIAMMTTAASELELYHGKKNFTSNTNITRKSKDNQNKLS